MSTTLQGHIDQAELAALLKNKDKAAMKYLYENYSAALYGVILRIVVDEKVAEEVLQDAFLKIWDKIATYDAQKGRLFTWMLNLTRNLAIDKLRSKEIKRVQKTDELSNNVYNIERDNLIHQNIDTIGVEKFLDKLREEERLVIDLIYFRGYTQSEVSEEKNIPLGTVKTRLRMALTNLRKELGVR
ncbi:sigma-70 family RNA polymerase sigma factor [Fulvivirga maritima]|uniref:RNA polymerase sigma factor n=1 Tax=Fulvivirga maritima TaxID=2904247 RepID=UPI001F1D33C3|nr:sigma-70 family RNA polymerase sigma factor [Fulvivirga maritima]UII28562.1 sigma-70 family RNA polymerase sigma factor [Fulvivirga maritima]